MNETTFAKKLKSIYEKACQPLVYILVVAALALRLLPWPEFAIPALMALGLIMLPIIFEIHKAVTATESPRWFPSYNDAIPTIKHALDAYLQGESAPLIRVLGYGLYYQWPMLDSYLTNVLLRPNPPRLTLQIALLDREWDELERVSTVYDEQARSTITAIECFVKDHRDQILNCGWSVEVWTYRFTPHWFGMLIGDSKLFLGRTFWDNGRLRGGSNPLEMLTRGDGLLQLQKIEEFLGWFKKCQEQKCNIGLSVTGVGLDSDRTATSDSSKSKSC